MQGEFGAGVGVGEVGLEPEEEFVEVDYAVAIGIPAGTVGGVVAAVVVKGESVLEFPCIGESIAVAVIGSGEEF